MTNDLPVRLRDIGDDLICDDSKATVFEAIAVIDALRSRLELAEAVCEAVIREQRGLEEYDKLDRPKALLHVVERHSQKVGEAVESWRSARDAKPEEGG